MIKAEDVLLDNIMLRYRFNKDLFKFNLINKYVNSYRYLYVIFLK